MIQFMWQANLHGVAKFVTDCLGVYYDTDPDRGRASDQPWVAGRDVMLNSLSLMKQRLSDNVCCQTLLPVKMFV